MTGVGFAMAAVIYIVITACVRGSENHESWQDLSVSSIKRRRMRQWMLYALTQSQISHKDIVTISKVSRRGEDMTAMKSENGNNSIMPPS
jgi:hypothetical protein